MKKAKAFLNWSGGKDALFALHQLQNNKEYSIDCLLTTVNKANNRVSMHGLPLALVEEQAKSIGIPLKPVFLEPDIGLEEYNRVMNRQLADLKSQGYTHSIFGDILLDDLKKYREQQLAKMGLTGVFPLWKRDTKTLAADFVASGYKAIVVVVNDKALSRSFCGRLFDYSFLEELPPTVDPCGENGEFHTFVYDGPLFTYPVPFKMNGVVEKLYQPSSKSTEPQKDCYKTPEEWDIKFWFADLQKA